MAQTSSIHTSTTIKITNLKSVYTMLPETLSKLKRRGIPTVCRYHEGMEGAEIKVGDRVYSASKTRWRSAGILAHTTCALRKNVILQSDLDRIA